MWSKQQVKSYQTYILSYHFFEKGSLSDECLNKIYISDKNRANLSKSSQVYNQPFITLYNESKAALSDKFTKEKYFFLTTKAQLKPK